MQVKYSVIYLQEPAHDSTSVDVVYAIMIIPDAR